MDIKYFFFNFFGSIDFFRSGSTSVLPGSGFITSSGVRIGNGTAVTEPAACGVVLIEICPAALPLHIDRNKIYRTHEV